MKNNARQVERARGYRPWELLDGIRGIDYTQAPAVLHEQQLRRVEMLDFAIRLASNPAVPR